MELPVIGPYINAGGWLAVIVLVLVSMVRGWLYSENQVNKIIDGYKQIIENKNEIIADKNEQVKNWEEAFKNSDARADILAENQRGLLETVKASNDLIVQALSNLPSNKKEITR